MTAKPYIFGDLTWGKPQTPTFLKLLPRFHRDSPRYFIHFWRKSNTLESDYKKGINVARNLEARKQEQNEKGSLRNASRNDQYLNQKLREKRFEIRFLVEEFEQIRIAFAERTQYCSLAQFCREVLLEASAKEKPIVSREALLSEFLGVQNELRRIGANINQIAKLANHRKGIGDQVNDLQAQVEEALKINNQVLKKVYGRK